MLLRVCRPREIKMKTAVACLVWAATLLVAVEAYVAAPLVSTRR